MTTENVTPQDDRIRACAIARDLESFEYLIDEMQTIFGDGWGGLEIDDALPVLSSKHAAQIEHVILALGPDDANHIDQIVQIIDRAKSSNQNVTLVTHDLSSNALHQLLRSGADDFVPYPLPKGSLEALLVSSKANQMIDVAGNIATPAATEPSVQAPVTAPAPEAVKAPVEQAQPVAEPAGQASRLDLSSPVNTPKPTPEAVEAVPEAEPAPVVEGIKAEVADPLVEAARDTVEEKVEDTKETLAEAIEVPSQTIGDNGGDEIAQSLAAKLDKVEAPEVTIPEVDEMVDLEKPAESLKLERAVPEEAKPEDEPEQKPEAEPAQKSIAQKLTERVAGVAPISLKNNETAPDAEVELKDDGFERLVKAAIDGETVDIDPPKSEVETLHNPEADKPAEDPKPAAEAPKPAPAPAEPTLVAQGTPRPANRGGKNGIVFPVYGCAGGVGASTFAANLGWEIQSLVEKEGRNVCIIDLGLQYGSVATYLDVPRSDATMELLTNMASADEQALQATMKFHKDKMAVFASPVDPVPLELVEPSDVGQLIDLATSVYDIVIIDMPNTLTSWTETVLDRAKLFFAFTEMEMRSAQNALRFLRALKAEELPYEKVQFVINRAPKMTDLAGRSRIKRMSDSLNVEFRWLLPDGGKQVVAAGDQGATLANVAARNPLRKEIRKIAEKMTELSVSTDDVKASA